jgi:hypothetical protein
MVICVMQRAARAMCDAADSTGIQEGIRAGSSVIHHILQHVLGQPAAHTPNKIVNGYKWGCNEPKKKVSKADGFDAVPACKTQDQEESNEDEHVVCRGQERSITHETCDCDPHGECRTEDTSCTPNSIRLSRNWPLCVDKNADT